MVTLKVPERFRERVKFFGPKACTKLWCTSKGYWRGGRDGEAIAKVAKADLLARERVIGSSTASSWQLPDGHRMATSGVDGRAKRAKKAVRRRTKGGGFGSG